MHPCRKYEAIHDELNKMEAMRVIARETEPTDWVSSLTFTEERDGTLRLCLDSKDLNRLSSGLTLKHALCDYNLPIWNVTCPFGM